MARKCDICGKGTVYGQSVPRKGQPKKKGGAGQHIGVTTKRTFKANIVTVKASVAGALKTMRICTRCLRAGKIQKV